MTHSLGPTARRPTRPAGGGCVVVPPLCCACFDFCAARVFALPLTPFLPRGLFRSSRSLAGWRPSTRHATRGPPLRLSVTRGLGGGPLFTFLAVVGCGSRAQPMPAGWQPCRRVRLDGHSSQVESSFPSDSEAAPPAVESIGRVDATTIISARQRRCLWGAAGPLIPLAASGTSKLHLRVCKSVSRES